MNGKIKAGLVLLIVFILGCASGMTWQMFRFHHYGPPHAMFVDHRIKRLSAQLKLSPAQQESVREIFQKAHDRASQVNEEVSWDLADIHRDSVKAIREILTPDQIREFDKLHNQYHGRYKHILDDVDESSGTAVPKAHS